MEAVNFQEEAEANPVTSLRSTLSSHIAWKPNVHSDSEAKAMLAGHESFTYLIRSTASDDIVMVSFVNAEGSVEHKKCILMNAGAFNAGNAKEMWLYQNACPHVTCDFDELLPAMMHCEAGEPCALAQ